MRLLTVVVVVCGLGLAACSEDPKVARVKYLESGRGYAKAGKLPEAVLEFRNSVQQDPRFGPARYELAEALLKSGDGRGAYQEFIRAADLLPNDVNAQLRAGQMYLLAGQFDEARRRAGKALKIAPSNVDALILRGSALAGLKKFDEALSLVEDALALDPQRSATHTELGFLRLARGESKEAEASFKEAVAANPRDMTGYIALANYYWRERQFDTAEATLRQGLSVEPKNVAINRALAMVLVGSGRPADAEQPLKTIAEVSNDVTSKLALADYYQRLGRDADALALLRTVESDPKGFVPAKARMATVFYARGQKKEAYAAVDEALAREPGNSAALLTKAQFLSDRRSFDEAAALVTKVTTGDPKNMPAFFALGRIEGARGNADAAIEAFNQVLKINPRLVAAKMEIARLHFSTLHYEDAQRYVQEALDIEPANGDALLLQARSQMAAGHPEKAVPTMKALSTQFPKAPSVHSQLGTLNVMLRDTAAARASYEKALSLDDTNAEALAGLTSLDVTAGRQPAARARLDAVVAKHPDQSQVLIVASQGYFAMQDPAAAERHLRRLISIEPSNLKAYGMLGMLLARQQRVDEAIREFETMHGKNPKSVGANTMIAMLYEVKNNRPEARKRYQQVLSVDPLAPVAANNLAWIYADEGQNLDEALQLAQTARVALPESPEVSDTLGWIYFKKGMYSQAVSVLKETVDRAPDNATFEYHLGIASAKSGDLALGRRVLERALKRDPGSVYAAEGRAALNTIATLGS